MFTTAVSLLNKNVDWVHEKHVGVFYLMTLVCVRVILFAVPVNNHIQWTLLHWFHTIFTFITFHHSKGSPDDNLMGQGKYGYLTWWEQLDNGKQFTWEKKILTVAPILLFLLVCHTTQWDHTYLIFNFLGLALVLVPKLPGMHKLRPFGFNEGYY